MNSLPEGGDPLNRRLWREAVEHLHDGLDLRVVPIILVAVSVCRCTTPNGVQRVEGLALRVDADGE